MRRLCGWISIAAVVLATSGAMAARPKMKQAVFSEEAVNEAIRKGTEYLLSRQLDNGAWPDLTSGGAMAEGKERQAGVTSLVTYALLAQRMGIKDESIAKALKWLKKERAGWTYTLGLRCQVWLLASREDKVYDKWLARDVSVLIKAAGARKECRGAYDYRVLSVSGKTQKGRRKKKKDPLASKRFDNSNTQYGVLGVWAGWAADHEIPRLYWRRVMDHWTSCQQKDGGWQYYKTDEKNSRPTTPSMTAAGLASMFVCYDAYKSRDFLECGQATENESIQRGLAWFDENFAGTLTGKVPANRMPYYLYSVERVGLASGYKYFGQADWFRLGAAKLLSSQAEDGSWDCWGTDSGTALALLFLIRGSQPLLLNRLQYKGDWKNRSRALANFCHWATKVLERDVNWQIVGLETDPGDWHDAPILVITGHKAPTFTDEELEKLRTFVWQGGTILSIAECEGVEFDRAMKAVYKKLFPQRKMVDLSKTHPIYGLHYDLKGSLKLGLIDNGVRALAIHCPVDVVKAWQNNKPEEDTEKLSFEAGLNMAMFVTDKTFQRRGSSRWPSELKDLKGSVVTVAKLQHAANADCEPLAWQRMARRLGHADGVRVEVSGPVAIGELAKAPPKLAILSGTGTLELSADEKAALKSYVQEGGTLLVEAVGGRAPFARSARQAVEDMFGPTSMELLTLKDPLFAVADRKIEKIAYRRATRKRTIDKGCHLEAVRMKDGRIGVLFSREDLTEGLLGTMPLGCDGYMPDNSYSIVRNVVLGIVDYEKLQAERKAKAETEAKAKAEAEAKVAPEPDKKTGRRRGLSKSALRRIRQIEEEEWKKMAEQERREKETKQRAASKKK